MTLSVTLKHICCACRAGLNEFLTDTVGWLTGLEPATTGITIRDSTN
jgi:hypothetical protein